MDILSANYRYLSGLIPLLVRLDMNLVQKYSSCKITDKQASINTNATLPILKRDTSSASQSYLSVESLHCLLDTSEYYLFLKI